MTTEFFAPTAQRIAQARAAIKGQLIETPVLDLAHPEFTTALGQHASLKLELFQQAGSFKARGVYLAIQALDQPRRDAGVVAVSAGNHAIAVAWGARAVGVSAKVCLPKTAAPFRVELCQQLGAQVIQCDDIANAFVQCQRIQADEGRTLLHPFESAYMTLGAATCAAEFLDARPLLEVLVVPMGGGGFISGMAAGVKALKPSVKVYGVEPVGAATVSTGLANGVAGPVSVSTIADSLGAPMSMPNSLALIQAHVDHTITISDDAMRHGMKQVAETLNLLPEPACVASLVAAMGPLREHCHGKHLGLIACGSNISVDRWQKLANDQS